MSVQEFKQEFKERHPIAYTTASVPTIEIMGDMSEEMSVLRYKIGKFIVINMHRILIKLRLIS